MTYILNFSEYAIKNISSKRIESKHVKVLIWPSDKYKFCKFQIIHKGFFNTWPSNLFFLQVQTINRKEVYNLRLQFEQKLT